MVTEQQQQKYDMNRIAYTVISPLLINRKQKERKSQEQKELFT